MTPEYLHELADLADPQQLWRLSVLEQRELTKKERQQLDTGVALRRHAMHIRRLDDLRLLRRSLVVTPIAPNHTAIMDIEPPGKHKKLLRDRDALAPRL